MPTGTDGGPYNPTWGHLDMVDIPAYMEGEVVQLVWDRPFDWSLESPELIGDS